MAEGLVRVRLASADVVRDSDSGLLVLNLDGATTQTFWPAGYIPTAGDVVRVLVSEGSAQVLGPVISGPRPGEGTVAGAASGGRVPVSTSSGTMQARFAGTAPGIGQLVLLDWQTTTPRLLGGAATAVVIPPPPEPTEPPTPAPPEPRPQRGTTTVAAVESSTYGSASGWNRYGDTVNQHRYGSEAESTGAWFYGSRMNALEGATITGARMYIPARRRIGSYNSSATLNLYRHSSGRRPSGNVNRTGPSHGVSLPAGWSGGWRDIPVSLAQALVDDGGGIAIYGAPYAGVLGLSGSASSGRLRLEWTRSS